MITARDYRAGTSAFDLRQGPSAQRDIFTRNAGLGSLTANGGVGESRTMDMPPPNPHKIMSRDSWRFSPPDLSRCVHALEVMSHCQSLQLGCPDAVCCDRRRQRM